MTNSEGSRHPCAVATKALLSKWVIIHYTIVISDLCYPLISPFYNAEVASKELETSEETFLGQHGILCHFTEPGRTKCFVSLWLTNLALLGLAAVGFGIKVAPLHL